MVNVKNGQGTVQRLSMTARQHTPSLSTHMVAMNVVDEVQDLDGVNEAGQRQGWSRNRPATITDRLVQTAFMLTRNRRTKNDVRADSYDGHAAQRRSTAWTRGDIRPLYRLLIQSHFVPHRG